ncbi:VIN3-like protein 2 [Malania oleifera]|uniref:VIN3-like protein 2 n=1 Tax=Malania oleifera TaxID=397392 RepID=UPI0025AE43B9|nr:VIN3-like protein 2 [Malania oleifera]
MRNPEQRVSEMELFSDFVLDPAKSSQLSLEEKRGLVRVIAQWSNEAPQLLHSWTRRELLEIICAEMGKERKYSGFTKLKMIQHLLKLVSEKSKRNNGEYSPTFSPANIQNGSKRPRKDEHTVKLSGDPHCVPLDNTEKLLCRNLACRATLSPEDAFCKRCSCCICHQYDDNKDPSLWLICSSDLPGEGDSCGMSCHLTCALRHDRAGIMKDGCCTKLDGYFYCVSCGKIKGLMRTWRKQLLVAKEARRVDVLCLRVFLSYQILNGTDKYKELNEIVESAMKKLRHEVGPLDQVCIKMARGIVNRLSCGAEVQKLCASAVEAFDSMHAAPSPDSIDQREHTKCKIQFEECSPTSVIIVLEYEDNLLEELLGCKLWHRKSTVQDYPEQPTYIVLRPERRFKIIDLDPSSEYFCKVSLFSSMRILGTWEAKWISTALSGSTLSIFNEHEKEESSLQAQKHSQLDSKDSRNNELVSRDHRPKIQDGINKNKNEGFNLLPPSIKDVPLTCPLSISPLMPCKMDGAEEAFGSGIKQDSNYEYSVRAIKLLELEGHIDNEFRVKFLTWFSLKATMQDRRIVSVFVDTFMDDAPSLAGQLIDAFTDKICSGLKPVSQNGFCT